MKMYRHKQSGLTLIEMIMLVFGIAVVLSIAGILYVVTHFITKFW